MSEKCPLGSGLYWVSEQPFAVPDVCLTQCEEIWDAASQKQADDLDVFDPKCEHIVEHGGTSLQRAGGVHRSLGILSICEKTGDDAFAESWSFICPFENTN